jgi:hypothetical protein
MRNFFQAVRRRVGYSSEVAGLANFEEEGMQRRVGLGFLSVSGSGYKNPFFYNRNLVVLQSFLHRTQSVLSPRNYVAPALVDLWQSGLRYQEQCRSIKSNHDSD